MSRFSGYTMAVKSNAYSDAHTYSYCMMKGRKILSSGGTA